MYYTVYIMHYTVYIIRLYSIYCAPYGIRLTSYSVYYSLYSINLTFLQYLFYVSTAYGTINYFYKKLTSLINWCNKEDNADYLFF